MTSLRLPYLMVRSPHRRGDDRRRLEVRSAEPAGAANRRPATGDRLDDWVLVLRR